MTTAKVRVAAYLRSLSDDDPEIVHPAGHGRYHTIYAMSNERARFNIAVGDGDEVFLPPVHRGAEGNLLDDPWTNSVWIAARGMDRSELYRVRFD